MKTSLSFRLLLGRFLTRSGDQAWDFAVPIILLKILPNHLRIAALYYLLIKLLGVILIPRVAAVIDTRDRMSVVKLGLLLQFFGVLLSAASVYSLYSLKLTEPSFNDPKFIIVFCFMVVTGLIGSLGASLMDIAIANDLAPTVFSGTELSHFNSRFRQVDLVTEVGSPVMAGLLMAVTFSALPLAGFALVILWNLVSFVPEYIILSSVFEDRPELKNKIVQVAEGIKKSFVQKITEGWKELFKQPIAPVMIAYALLWLSALSPHGVLLTGFLQDGWRTPEWLIGLFRGSGAFFGLAATFLFPLVLKVTNVRRASGIFLGFQALMVAAAFGFFLLGGTIGQNGFLILVLFSRIGIYGFSLGEVQIRQEEIPPSVRGQINGFANALTGIATLILFGAGAILPNTDDFRYLVLMSVICVFAAFLIYASWLKKSESLKRI